MSPIAAQIFTSLISDLYDQPIMGNQYRANYVERMVVLGLGSGFRIVGMNWAGWDISGPSDLRIEVKQSAARQVWTKDDNGPAKGTFDIAPRSGYYLEDGSTWIDESGRPAHIYILAWHPVFDSALADHRNPDQWQFFVIPAAELPPTQKCISLPVVTKRWQPVSFAELRDETMSSFPKGLSTLHSTAKD